MERADRATPLRLFAEWFKIALFVVGGGYAIIAVADNVFGRKLKWLDDGELLDHLPVISSVPGLIAGNSAIYVGLKTCGRTGAIAALAGVALPSILIFLAVSAGFCRIPRGDPWIESVFLGLRSAIAGIVAGTIWRTVFAKKNDLSKGYGIPVAPLTRRERAVSVAAGAAFLAAAAAVAWKALVPFLAFGCIAIGGGYPLVPFYFHTFVGPDAPLINMSPEMFSDLMAVAQATPGPISINAATFFGYSIDGVAGAFVASAALLAPSFFMMSAVLSGLERWKDRPATAIATRLMHAVSIVLLSAALYRFCAYSIWDASSAGAFHIRMWPLAIAMFAATAYVRRWLQAMPLVLLCAVLGAAAAFWARICPPA